MDNIEGARGKETLVIQHCPGKTYSVISPDGGLPSGLGVTAELLDDRRPESGLERMMQTRCDGGCNGPIKIPRKVLGITLGQKEVCPMGYSPKDTPIRRGSTAN